MTPARGDLYAYRWVPFDLTIPFEGVDFTGANFGMQVRLYPDAPGSPLISLAKTDSGEGLSASVATVDNLTTSFVKVRIDAATINGVLPIDQSEVEPNTNVELAYDLIVSTDALGTRRWLEGRFIIVPGVTR